MSNFYYNMMSHADQHVYRNALNGVRNCKSNIRVGRVSNDKFAKIAFKISYDHPELFYVNFSQIISTYDSITGLTWNVRYRFSTESINLKIEKMKKKIERIVSNSGLTSNSTIVEKYRWIHDTIVKNVEYDYSALQNSSAYPEAYTIQGVFEKKKAVCEGVALAVIALGDRLGLEIGFISGRGNSEQAEFNSDHGWNVVRVDRGYLHMDVTWDMCLSRKLRFTRYDYFLIPDSEIEIDHIVEERPVSASAAGYSFFELTGRDFTTHKQCSDYVSNAVKNKKDTFYFRLRIKGETPEQSDMKLQSMIMKKAALRLLYGGVMESSHNLDKGIFYYKVQGY